MKYENSARRKESEKSFEKCFIDGDKKAIHVLQARCATNKTFIEDKQNVYSKSRLKHFLRKTFPQPPSLQKNFDSVEPDVR